MGVLVFVLFLVALVFFLVVAAFVVLVVLLLVLLFFKHFFGQGQIVAGLVVVWNASERLFVGFHGFFVLLVFHEYVAHVVECLVFIHFFLSGFTCLFVSAKSFTKTFPIVVGVPKVEPCGCIFITFGNGPSVIRLSGHKIVGRKLLIGFVCQVFGNLQGFFGLFVRLFYHLVLCLDGSKTQQ